MLCENCGKHPAQRFVRNVDGREIVVQLCPACFRMLYSEKQSGHWLQSTQDGCKGRANVVDGHRHGQQGDNGGEQGQGNDIDPQLGRGHHLKLRTAFESHHINF